MSKSKMLTYVVVAILVLIGIYWAYQMFNKKAEVAPVGVTVVTDTVPSLTDNSNSSNKLIAALNEIDSIDLQNRLILNNKIFTGLKDFGRTIEDRAIGRANPFSPFVGGAGAGLLKNEKTATSSTKDTNGSGATGEENPADANLLDALSGE
ncbi:MAG: hypothetical protein WC385_01740 [Candidatus Paceibacterota bacterium]